jgi:hypothetical protein
MPIALRVALAASLGNWVGGLFGGVFALMILGSTAAALGRIQLTERGLWKGGPVLDLAGIRPPGVAGRRAMRRRQEGRDPVPGPLAAPPDPRWPSRRGRGGLAAALAQRGRPLALPGPPRRRRTRSGPRIIDFRASCDARETLDAGRKDCARRASGILASPARRSNRQGPGGRPGVAPSHRRRPGEGAASAFKNVCTLSRSRLDNAKKSFADGSP